MLTRNRGLGNIDLLDGTPTAGYYGKYTGICTPNEIITLADITEGTTKNDDWNDPTQPITWLKYSHNHKTLFVADRTIRHSISWNHLESKGVVFGKVIEIAGQKYLLRLLQGANVNPANAGGGLNDEWDSLIVAFTPDTEDSHWDSSDPVNNSIGDYAWTQETPSANISNAIMRGATALSGYHISFQKSYTGDRGGYRPVLEIL